jgi:hypothetical protein
MLFLLKLAFILLIFTITSCGKMILNSKGTHAREIKVFEKEELRVLFIGMTHLAKPSFFNDVKEQIDSLRSEGYVFFKEGVYFEENTTAAQKDTLQRKFRQLIGLTIGDYTDQDNKSLTKYFSSGDYMMQSDSLIGLNSEDFSVDLSYNEMIDIHEKKYGSINLTDCDWSTDMYAPYECTDGNAFKKSFHVVDIARTDFLYETVLKSDHKKIAIVYGAGHFKWLYPDMLKAGYQYKNKKLSFK